MVGVIRGMLEVLLDDTLFGECEFVVREMSEEPRIVLGLLGGFSMLDTERSEFLIEGIDGIELTGGGILESSLVTVSRHEIPPQAIGHGLLDLLHYRCVRPATQGVESKISKHGGIFFTPGDFLLIGGSCPLFNT